ncbi:hypothetical protein ABW21_db0209695 [Orbilia brochopaga]|nr:hypothetical protein ABW21_db0209695 [Drechslerella brochopaga]
MTSSKPTLPTLPLELQTKILLSLHARDFTAEIFASMTCRTWQHLYSTDPQLQRARYNPPPYSGILSSHRLLNNMHGGMFGCAVVPTTGAIESYQQDNPLGSDAGEARDISSCLFLDDPIISPSDPLPESDDLTIDTQIDIELPGIHVDGMWSPVFKLSKSSTIRDLATLVAQKVQKLLHNQVQERKQPGRPRDIMDFFSDMESADKILLSFWVESGSFLVVTASMPS